jgi:putative ABC transport system permease protein
VVGRFAGSLLYGVRPVDPPVLAVTALALALVAGLASYFPGRQATRVDPHAALGEE